MTEKELLERLGADPIKVFNQRVSVGDTVLVFPHNRPSYETRTRTHAYLHSIPGGPQAYPKGIPAVECHDGCTWSLERISVSGKW